MGIKERQERDRETVRRAILDAARELFVHEGYQNVSIRKIAERVEYSPAAIYSYFPSKDDIFFALAEEGFRLLETGDATVLDGSSSLEQLRRSLWRLYEFSREQPQYFALMFVDRSVPRIGREYERFSFARDMKARLLDQIRLCAEHGDLRADVAPEVLIRLLTVGLLGVAVFRLSERLGSGESADDLARDVLEVTIAGLRPGLMLKLPTPVCLADAHSDSPVS